MYRPPPPQEIQALLSDLEQLVNGKILVKHKLGRENFYIHQALFDILQNIDNLTDTTLR